MTVALRDHTFLGTTQSLCPECLQLIPAKIVVKRDGRVYFRKRCPTHGVREDFVCSDVRWYDRMEYSVPGRQPVKFGVEPSKGCPYDCGLCTEHEQHTCIALVEITSSCNLKCPMCFASSGPGGKHWSVAEAKAAIDRVVRTEGRAEIIQLSGGEPTIHPQFAEIFEYACDQAVDYVMINTNGLRLAKDRDLLQRLADRKKRLEVYFQFDGFSEHSSKELRGESLVETKLQAIERLGELGIHTILVTTLQPDVNESEIGAIVEFGLARPWITGVSFQPATYSGRHVLPEILARRITFPDVVKAVVEQTNGLFAKADFLPLPCAHPNCHTITYAYRAVQPAVPLARFINAHQNLDLLANGITFTRPRVKALIEHYLGKISGCGSDCGCNPMAEPARVPATSLVPPRVNPLTNPEANGTSSDTAELAAALGLGDGGRLKISEDPHVQAAALDFFMRAIREDLYPEDVFRVTITSFLDAYNFDVRRLMKCCIHHALPSGHVIPFCAYNVLYREGHVPLPTLQKFTSLTPITPAPAAVT